MVLVETNIDAEAVVVKVEPCNFLPMENVSSESGKCTCVEIRVLCNKVKKKDQIVLTEPRGGNLLLEADVGSGVCNAQLSFQGEDNSSIMISLHSKREV